jgi:hypothetical protein
MATVIQIKRSTTATAPTTSALAEAEMAYAQDKSNDGSGAILYIESVNNDNSAAIHKVGGKYYTDLVDAATSAKTANAIVKRDGSGAISADVTGNVTGDITGDITGDVTGNLTGNVTGNVTGDVTGNADTASAWATARTLTLGGDLSGSVSIDGSGDITLNGTVSGADATTLTGLGLSSGGQTVIDTGTDGTDATFIGALTGDVTGNVTGNVTGDLTGDVTGDVTGNLTGNVTGDVTGNADSATALETARTIGGVSFDGSANIDLPGVNAAGNQDTSGNAATASALETARAISTSGDATGTVNFDGSADADIALTLANSGVTAASYGSTTAIPVLTVDAKGRITAASTAEIATSFSITDGSNTDTVAGGETLTFEGSTNETNVVVSNNKVTVGLVDNPTIGGNLTVSGDLTVSGTTTQVNTTNMAVEDSLVAYATGNASDAVDIGFFGKFNDGAAKTTGLFRDANDGKFNLFESQEDITGNVIDKSAVGYAVATLIANIEGNVTGNLTGDVTGNVTGNLTGNVTGDITGDVTGNVTGNLTGDVTGSLSGGTVSGLSAAIAVADGGTGAGTFTSNGIIFGNGTGAMQVTAAGTEGKVLIAGSGGTPEFADLDGGTY